MSSRVGFGLSYSNSVQIRVGCDRGPAQVLNSGLSHSLVCKYKHDKNLKKVRKRKEREKYKENRNRVKIGKLSLFVT